MDTEGENRLNQTNTGLIMRNNENWGSENESGIGWNYLELIPENDSDEKLLTDLIVSIGQEDYSISQEDGKVIFLTYY